MLMELVGEKEERRQKGKERGTAQSQHADGAGGGERREAAKGKGKRHCPESAC